MRTPSQTRRYKGEILYIQRKCLLTVAGQSRTAVFWIWDGQIVSSGSKFKMCPSFSTPGSNHQLSIDLIVRHLFKLGVLEQRHILNMWGGPSPAAGCEHFCKVQDLGGAEYKSGTLLSELETWHQGLVTIMHQAVCLVDPPVFCICFNPLPFVILLL